MWRGKVRGELGAMRTISRSADKSKYTNRKLDGRARHYVSKQAEAKRASYGRG